MSVTRGSGMRVIAGSLKGRRLAPPTWDGLRPTSDRLRETLFDILGDRVAGASILDGFAGTGALGIEAVSRGAGHVVFVDADRRATRLIAENLRRSGVGDRYAIIRATLHDAARRRLRDRKFDLVLLDPPYDEEDLAGVLAVGAGCLAADGLIVLEQARRRGPQAAGPGLERTRGVRSGDSMLSFYRLSGSAGDL